MITETDKTNFNTLVLMFTKLIETANLDFTERRDMRRMLGIMVTLRDTINDYDEFQDLLVKKQIALMDLIAAYCNAERSRDTDKIETIFKTVVTEKACLEAVLKQSNHR